MSNGYDEIKFLCDGTVGKLAKILRILGYDAESCTTTKPQEVTALALDDERYILTRNTAFSGKKLARDITLFEESDPWEQFKKLVKKLGLKPESARILTRCLEDNTPLDPVDKKKIKDEIYPYVFETQDRFTRCPTCKRIYWPGTHVEAMLQKLKEHDLTLVDIDE